MLPVSQLGVAGVPRPTSYEVRGHSNTTPYPCIFPILVQKEAMPKAFDIFLCTGSIKKVATQYATAGINAASLPVPDKEIPAMHKSPLDRIKVAAPCDAEWRWMYGSDRVRFCGQCSKNVYNLSAMSTEEAEDLVRHTEGQLCDRFYRRADGTFLTGDNCPVGIRAIGKRLSKWAAAAAAAALGFFANVGLLGLADKPGPGIAVTPGQMAPQDPPPIRPGTPPVMPMVTPLVTRIPPSSEVLRRTRPAIERPGAVDQKSRPTK